MTEKIKEKPTARSEVYDWLQCIVTALVFCVLLFVFVVRMVDVKRNTLVYLSYSDRLVDGSPQNSVTAVPVDRSIPIPIAK